MRGYASFRVQICLNDIVEMRKFFEYTSFFCDAEAIREGIDSVLFQWCRVLEYTVDALLREKRRKTVAAQRSGIARVLFFANFRLFRKS